MGLSFLSKIAFLFPGQGAQLVGMGRLMYDSLPAARNLFDRANEVLGYDLVSLCFEGPEEDLDSTIYSQPALYVTSLCAVELLRERAPETVDACAATAGLSLGEYTAMTFAGVMDFESGLRLVQRRGEAMQDAADMSPSAMVSILGLEPAQVESICTDARGDKETLEVANLLCPGNIVISGSNAACERAVEMAASQGAVKAVPLAVAGAFHTELMRPAVASLSVALASVSMSPARIPLIANVDAAPHVDPDEMRRLLVEQIVSAVRWEDSMRYLVAEGFDEFYEIGPGRVLRGLLRRIDRSLSCQSVMER